MVRSLDPELSGEVSELTGNLVTDRTEPGRRLSNKQIGQAMLDAKRRSVQEMLERHGPNKINVPLEAVQRLQRAAVRRAKQTGQTVSQVLEEHQEAIEEQAPRGNSRYLVAAETHRGPQSSQSATALQVAMAAQDERRADQRFTRITTAAAQAVDVETGTLALYPHRPELVVPRHVGTDGTSMVRLPARRNESASMTPASDILRLTSGPPRAVRSDRVMALLDNPTGGGGLHNPIMSYAPPR